VLSLVDEQDSLQRFVFERARVRDLFVRLDAAWVEVTCELCREIYAFDPKPVEQALADQSFTGSG
jgi:redox-regulated HSP33 family molecular chaperone